MSLGENIRTGRQALGLTQDALGEKLSVAGQTVSKWERDESMPDAAMLPKLAELLCCSLDRLFDRRTACYEDAETAVKNWLLALERRERWQGVMRLGRIVQAVLSGMVEVLPPAFVKESLGLRNFDSGSASGEGFSIVSVREELSLFTLFPEPEAGWGPALERDAPVLWEALSSAEVRKCLRAIYGERHYMRMDRGYLDLFLAKCGISDTEKALSAMEDLGVLRRDRARIDGKDTEIFAFRPIISLLQLLLLGGAGELGGAGYGPKKSS